MGKLDNIQFDHITFLIENYNNGKSRENRITQAKLAQKIGLTPEHFNRALHDGKLTIKSAQKVADFFNVRLQYVLGMDNFKTENEITIRDLNDSRSKVQAVCTLAYLAGYEIDLFSDMTSDGKIEAEKAISSLKEGYKIKKAGQILANCPLERFNLICQDILELTDQRIRSYIRETSNDGEYKEN